MSQLDGSAISEIKGMTLAASYLDNVKRTDCPVSVLPKDFDITSLERFYNNRFRFRGSLNTTSIDDFVKYSSGFAGLGASCFIDAESMQATSIFNIGTVENPGHADNTATIILKKTAPFITLLRINGEKITRRHWRNG